jgi:predicted membrane channel-forming protein YqfA (hemolysin III family)
VGSTLDSPAAAASRRGAGAWRGWFDFPRREQTRAEELANTVSHGLGLVAALVGIPFLVATAVRHGDLLSTVGAIVFSASVVALYLASTVYHSLPPGSAKRVFRVVEHSAIYLLIAGTYTPFALGVLRGPWGWTLLGGVWTFAAIGVALKASGRRRLHQRRRFAALARAWPGRDTCRASRITGIRPATTIASEAVEASARRSSAASL